MGRAAKTTESPPADTTLQKHLLELRNDESEAIKIVKYLEDEDLEDRKGNSFQKDKHDQKDKYDLKYCKVYVAILIQTYCETIESANNDEHAVVGSASDKSELLLAACGLLQGFEFKPRKQEQRIRDYRAYVCDNDWYNKLLIGDWSPTSAATKIRDILVRITRELATKVEALKSKNVKGKLDFFGEVPKELTLPAPRGGSKPKGQSVSGPSSLWERIMRTLSGLKDGLDLSKLSKRPIVCLCRLLTFVLPICVYCAPYIQHYAISINILPQQNINTVNYPERGGFLESNDPSMSSAEDVEDIKIINKDDLKLTPGSMTQLEFEITPPGTVKPYLFCDSENKQIVEVSDSGWVIARKEYQSSKPYERVQITVSTLTGKSDEAPVTVLYLDALTPAMLSDLLEGDLNEESN